MNTSECRELLDQARMNMDEGDRLGESLFWQGIGKALLVIADCLIYERNCRDLASEEANRLEEIKSYKLDPDLYRGK